MSFEDVKGFGKSVWKIGTSLPYRSMDENNRELGRSTTSDWSRRSFSSCDRCSGFRLSGFRWCRRISRESECRCSYGYWYEFRSRTKWEYFATSLQDEIASGSDTSKPRSVSWFNSRTRFRFGIAIQVRAADWITSDGMCLYANRSGYHGSSYPKASITLVALQSST